VLEDRERAQVVQLDGGEYRFERITTRFGLSAAALTAGATVRRLHDESRKLGHAGEAERLQPPGS
jgi:hypothetical protein